MLRYIVIMRNMVTHRGRVCLCLFFARYFVRLGALLDDKWCVKYPVIFEIDIWAA